MFVYFLVCKVRVRWWEVFCCFCWWLVGRWVVGLEDFCCFFWLERGVCSCFRDDFWRRFLELWGRSCWCWFFGFVCFLYWNGSWFWWDFLGLILFWLCFCFYRGLWVLDCLCFVIFFEIVSVWWRVVGLWCFWWFFLLCFLRGFLLFDGRDWELLGLILWWSFLGI